MKNSVDVVFVVLTYVNSDDLLAFFQSVEKQNMTYHVIVVDAFRDSQSSEVIKEIADRNGADYVPVPNKGYSYGNNYGINYAREHYDFKYVIVSNPDIVVKQLDINDLRGMENAVVGPTIINMNNKMQNPMYFKNNMFTQKLIYKGLKKNKKTLFYIGVGINKLIRDIGLKNISMSAEPRKVYQLHGSFVIFSRNVVDKIGTIYDDNIFLFAEESYLALSLKQIGIDSYYNPKIMVLHKEDGSMNLRDDINEQLKIANLYVFEKYYKFH